MESLRWFIQDVGPYAGVFTVMATVIIWQMRLIATMLEIEARLDNFKDGSDNQSDGDGHGKNLPKS